MNKTIEDAEVGTTFLNGKLDGGVGPSIDRWIRIRIWTPCCNSELDTGLRPVKNRWVIRVTMLCPTCNEPVKIEHKIGLGS